MLYRPGGCVHFDFSPVRLYLGAHFNPTYVWELSFLKGVEKGEVGEYHGYKKDGMLL
jgi:hypothetical protein